LPLCTSRSHRLPLLWRGEPLLPEQYKLRGSRIDVYRRLLRREVYYSAAMSIIIFSFLPSYHPSFCSQTPITQMRSATTPFSDTAELVAHLNQYLSYAAVSKLLRTNQCLHDLCTLAHYSMSSLLMSRTSATSLALQNRPWFSRNSHRVRRLLCITAILSITLMTFLPFKQFFPRFPRRRDKRSPCGNNDHLSVKCSPYL